MLHLLSIYPKNFRTANSFHEREEGLDNIESTISPSCLVTH